MTEYNITLPSQPRVISEDKMKGTYEIDGLHPGYGFTLGNSLRRIILSSLPGAAITTVKIDGVTHEFSTIEGVREDVINLILNLRQVRFSLVGDEPQVVTLSVKGPKTVTAEDIKTPGQVEVLNPDQYICEISGKVSLSIEMTVEKGLGFIPREAHQKTKMDIGTIAVDAAFTPIRRASYEVENMRVGDNTNFNRLKMMIETDGTISPREALESSIKIMIAQLKAIVNITDEEEVVETVIESAQETAQTFTKEDKKESPEMADLMKTRIDTIDLSTRTLNALTNANIRTIGGIARKRVEDLLEIEGMGEKGIQEIRKALSDFGITLKD